MSQPQTVDLAEANRVLRKDRIVEFREAISGGRGSIEEVRRQLRIASIRAGSAFDRGDMEMSHLEYQFAADLARWVKGWQRRTYGSCPDCGWNEREGA